MSKEAIENLKSGNYEVVDNRGVSVTTHFIECLEKEFADLETKLTESEDRIAKARRQAYSSRQMDNTLKIRRLADEITAKEKAITKLKQQLADKEQAIENWKTMYQSVMQTCNNDAKEIERLREQLAEKEKFLEQIMSGEYIPANIAEKSLKLSNQTSIAELEKVKKLLDDCYGYEYTSLYHFIQSKAEEKIDQRIKELKGEK